METSAPPRPALNLSPHLYCQLVYTLTHLLPPPLDDTPEALHARNHAAVAKVAALLPVNANEVDLAAQCIAARAQAEEMLRLLRQHTNDILLVTRLNAQYASMVRTSLSVHGCLMRVQALRRKREAMDGAATEDTRALHAAELSMLRVLHPAAGPQPAARPTTVPAATRVEPPAPSPMIAPAATRVEPPPPTMAPVATRVAAPAASVDQKAAASVSGKKPKSQDAALETWLSQQPWSRASGGPVETDLRKILRQSMAKSQMANWELAENARGSPGCANDGRGIDGQTTSA